MMPEKESQAQTAPHLTNNDNPLSESDGDGDNYALSVIKCGNTLASCLLAHSMAKPGLRRATFLATSRISKFIEIIRQP